MASDGPAGPDQAASARRVDEVTRQASARVPRRRSARAARRCSGRCGRDPGCSRGSRTSPHRCRSRDASRRPPAEGPKGCPWPRRSPRVLRPRPSPRDRGYWSSRPMPRAIVGFGETLALGAGVACRAGEQQAPGRRANFRRWTQRPSQILLRLGEGRWRPRVCGDRDLPGPPARPQVELPRSASKASTPRSSCP